VTRRTRRIWSTAAAALAVAALAGCSGSDGGTAAKPAAGRTVTGTLTLTAAAGSSDPCTSTIHPDVVDGTAVEVRDVTGNLLVTGSLGKGSADGDTCVHSLQLATLPNIAAYRLTIGSYGPIEVDAESLDAAGDVLDLRLGA
jgi:ABC-type transport system substrate-binding protein